MNHSVAQLAATTLALCLMGTPIARANTWAEVRAHPLRIQTLAQETTAEQCDRLSAVVNQTETFMADFEAEIAEFSGQAAQVETLEDIKAAAQLYISAVDRVVVRLANLAAELDGLTFTDTALTEFRADYAETVRGFAAALTTAAEAMALILAVESEADLPAAIEVSQQETLAAVDEIQVLSDRETEVVDGMNAYCDNEV